MRRHRTRGYYENPSTFPSTIVPSLWLDGRLVAFSDAAGSVIANAPLGRVVRVQQPTPLTGSWTSPNLTDARPFRDAASFCLETTPTTGNVGGSVLNPPAGSTVPANTVTVAGTIVHRVSPIVSSGNTKGILTGADQSTSGQWGPMIVNGFLCAFHNGALWSSALTIPLGTPTAYAIRYSPTGIDAAIVVGGVIATDSFGGAIIPGTIGGLTMGYQAGGEAFYGSMSQLLTVPRVISDIERASLLTWLAAQVPAVAFPAASNLVAISGDSIAEGYGLSSQYCWAMQMLPALEAASPGIKLLNLGIPSDSVGGAQAKFTTVIAPMYSSQRARNILIVQIGTNSIAFGTNTAAQNLAAIYAIHDGARAQGWKTIACAILPRSDGGIRGTFNADRATINADLAANWPSHADAFCPFAGVAGMGADGDSNNATNYLDLVHPSAIGAALLRPPIQAATISLL